MKDYEQLLEQLENNFSAVETLYSIIETYRTSSYYTVFSYEEQRARDITKKKETIARILRMRQGILSKLGKITQEHTDSVRHEIPNLSAKDVYSSLNTLTIKQR